MQSQAGSCSACKSCVETEGCDSSSVLILQELEIIEKSVTLNETIEDLCPAALLLVAMSELDVRMPDGCLLYG